MPYFLGADVGSTKTHVLIADEAGQAVGFGQAGPGNHESVGYAGLADALCVATDEALGMAGLGRQAIAGAGFGVAGYDWPFEKADTLHAISALGLTAPVAAVNDALIGLLAGSEAGWGVAVVSGTGCNCRGWDLSRQREGMVTGAGVMMGEAAGASEVMARVTQAIAYEWTGRGPRTTLSQTLLRQTGAGDLAELLHGLAEGQIDLTASAAPLVFEAAAEGDDVAREIITWAGQQLGMLATTVIRQLAFEALEFDLVMVGSLFNGGSALIEPMRQQVLALAPGARFVRLAAPPVVGAVLLGMEQAALNGPERRSRLTESTLALMARAAGTGLTPPATLS